MFSILLTAVVLLGALLASLRSRSLVRAAVCLGLAAIAFVLLGRRSLDDLAQPRTHFVYRVDETKAFPPGPVSALAMGSAVSARLSGMGHPQAEVSVQGSSVDILVPATREEAAHIRAALAVVGHLEFTLVADELDPFKEHATSSGAPSSLRFEVENAPLGPGKTAPRYYAFAPRADGEPSSDTLERLRFWTATLPLPENTRMAFEKVVRFDEATGAWEDEGWRTMVLAGTPILTGSHVRAAQAAPDQSKASLGGWIVRLEFTDEGGALFEEATGRHAKRRFAIALDGIVQSAPVIQGRISGGNAVITMGAGSLDEQSKSAKRLESVFRGGALPAPLLLVSEEHIPPPMGPLLYSALSALIVFTLLAEIAYALRLAFRKHSLTPASAP